MPKQTRNRVTRAALAFALAGGLGVTTGVTSAATAPATAAHAASTAGGAIARSETLSRAQYWVNQGVTYTQTGPWASDGGGMTYRRDCSGLVSMAWHLPNLGLPDGTGDSPVTDDFRHAHDASHPWSAVPGGLDGFLPGDAMVRPGHIEMFVEWVDPTDHGRGAYVYSFNRDGETVENPSTPSNFGYLGKDLYSDLTTYDPIRYDHIVDDTTTAAVDHQRGAVRTSDGQLRDFVVDTAGNMLQYQVGVGWTSVGIGLVGTPSAIVNPANNRFNVYVRSTTGSLLMYDPLAGWTTVGTGFASSPASVVAANGHVISFIRATDNSLWMVDPQGSGWTSVGTGLAGNPSAVLNPVSGRVNAYIRNTAGALLVFDTLNGWSTVGTGMAGDPSTVVDVNNHAITFIRATDNSLWSVDPQGAGWSQVGVGLTGNPSAVVDPITGHTQAYVRNTGGNLLRFDPVGGWITVGSGLAGDPTSITASNGDVMTFIAGSTGNLWTVDPQGAGWTNAGGTNIL